MKRGSCLFAACLALFTALACQKTPDAPIVLQKDMAQMLETALATPQAAAVETAAPAPQALADALSVPEVYTVSVSLDGGRFLMHGTVEPALPEAAALPVARVRLGRFSQERTDRMFDALCAGTPMYDFSGGSAPSQEEIVRIIGINEQLMQVCPERAAHCRSEILRLQAEAAHAPGHAERTPARPVLAEQTVEYRDAPGAVTGTQTSVSLAALPMGYGARFSVVNSPEYDGSQVVRIEHADGVVEYIGPQSRGAFHYSREQKLDRYLPTAHVLPLGETTRMSLSDEQPESCLLSVTPRQARRMAEDFLAQAGLADEMCVYAVLLNATDDDLFRRTGARRQCYEVRCLRRVAGVPVQSPAGGMASRTADGAYGVEWYYEDCVLWIDDGIAKLDWTAPLEVTELLTASANMLPFSEIASVFERTAPVVYRAGAMTKETDRCEVVLSRAELSLQRVCERNAYETGLLIPVWNFYGTVRVGQGGKQTSWDYDSKQPLLTINAIDGTVVDSAKGY